MSIRNKKTEYSMFSLMDINSPIWNDLLPLILNYLSFRKVMELKVLSKNFKNFIELKVLSFMTHLSARFALNSKIGYYENEFRIDVCNKILKLVSKMNNLSDLKLSFLYSNIFPLTLFGVENMKKWEGEKDFPDSVKKFGGLLSEIMKKVNPIKLEILFQENYGYEVNESYFQKIFLLNKAFISEKLKEFHYVTPRIDYSFLKSQYEVSLDNSKEKINQVINTIVKLINEKKLETFKFTENPPDPRISKILNHVDIKSNKSLKKIVLYNIKGDESLFSALFQLVNSNQNLKSIIFKNSKKYFSKLFIPRKLVQTCSKKGIKIEIED